MTVPVLGHVHHLITHFPHMQVIRDDRACLGSRPSPNCTRPSHAGRP
jgi:hypothetical protein